MNIEVWRCEDFWRDLSGTELKQTPHLSSFAVWPWTKTLFNLSVPWKILFLNEKVIKMSTPLTSRGAVLFWVIEIIKTQGMQGIIVFIIYLITLVITNVQI